MTITVTQLWRYPLKSGAAVSVPRAPVRPRGLEGDRRWMLIDANNRFITGRTVHHLPLLRASLTATGLIFNDTRSVAVPPPDAPTVAVKIWKDTVTARLAPPAASAWIAETLNIDCRLVYMDDDTRRAVDPDYASEDDIVSFADGFPLLLISEASLEDLNARLDRPVTMLHFRPNVVVTGCPPYAEDGWTHAQIGDARFRLVKRCSRCVFTTVDPMTGERDPNGEPLRTLKSYRRVGTQVMFGQNLLVERPGAIAVGDPVQLLDEG